MTMYKVNDTYINEIKRMNENEVIETAKKILDRLNNDEEVAGEGLTAVSDIETAIEALNMVNVFVDELPPSKRINLTQWDTILNNLSEDDKEPEIMWLEGDKDKPEEWVLCFDCELFEDGFKSEDEASHRLYIVNKATAKGIYFYDPQDGRENEPIDTFKLVDVYDNGTLLIHNVLDGHQEVTAEYIKTCQPITEEEYKKINKAWYR